MSPDHELLHFLLSDYEDKGSATGGAVMQMGHAWCLDRASREGLPRAALNSIKARNYDRRTALVSFESQGALDHAEALVDIHLGKADAQVHPHVDHGLTREWGKASIDAVEDARASARAARRASTPAKPAGGKKKSNK